MNALYVVGGLGFLILIAEIANVKRALQYPVMAGLLVASALLWSDWNQNGRFYHDMVVVDNYAIAFAMLILLISVMWLWIFREYFHEPDHVTERMSLVLFVILGGMLMVSANNMAILFLGIEILSISLYALAGSNRGSLAANEASFKYFLMGSTATGFLLMGITLIYGATGSFDLTVIATRVAGNTVALPGFFYAGVLLMLVAMAFKIAAAPFHFWAPDVYEGSPVMVTALMATVVKISAIGAFYKLLLCFAAVQGSWSAFLTGLIVLTLLIPNITAVAQTNAKRMLAYSSVGHVGYILMAFLGAPHFANGAVFFYLFAYAVASLAAFGIVMKVGENGSFAGLHKNNPLLAIGMSVCLLSLAGIPPLPGFFAKYMVFVAAIKHGDYTLTALAITMSLVAVYYYFKLIVQMFDGSVAREKISLPLGYRVVIVLLLAGIVAVGIMPDTLLSAFP